MPIGLNHHRNARDTIQQVESGEINVTNNEKPLRAGAEDLKNRKQLVVINDATGLFFISDETPFTIGTGNKFTVFSGEAIIIDLDPDIGQTWYAKTDHPSNELKIRVVEIK